METEGTNLNQQNDSSKPAKKGRLLSAKEFRTNLNSSEKLPALQQFLNCCNNDQNHDYVFEYLQEGGSCLELLQLLDTSSGVPPSIILETVNVVLLQIVSNYPQVHSATHEACNYFLNNHIALINKLLSLASTKQERKITLKLLTTIVTFSKKLAKEILLHVNFTPVNLEVLTKQTGEKESVRNAFIHFLVAFLVEGEFSVISILLEKKGLVSSIARGLQYDSAETVCLALTTLKAHILENPFVSKTAKMNVFNTFVIKDIVNLYNWKGPANFDPKKKLQTVTVDEYDKSRVNEAVHAFLLVLCTSYKFGVIFSDRQLGMGKIHNSLIYTVLKSLERPWEHSYAGELVTEICKTCPDLVKTTWTSLMTHLEPRATARWQNAIKYSIALVQKLEPSGIDFCARELSVHQLAQAIQFLIAPTPVLKMLVPEDRSSDRPSIKHHVFLLLVAFLSSIQKYLSAAANWLKPENWRTLKNLLNEHVLRNFPNAQNILNNWMKSDEDLGPYSMQNHVEVIFELLDLYESICPQLLESLSTVDLHSFLKELQELPGENSVGLQVYGIKIFANFEPSAFAPNTDSFAFALPLILEYYYGTKDVSAGMTLHLLLKNTGIFEGCLEEIDFWINGVFDVSNLDSEISLMITGSVRQTFANLLEYLFEMPKFLENSEVGFEETKLKDVLENLDNSDPLQNSSNFVLKHRGLSPLLLGALEYLQNVEQSKNLKTYFGSVLIHLLHSQTTPLYVAAVISNEKYKSLITKHIINYIQSWMDNQYSMLLKTKVHLAQNFSLSFLEGNIDEFLQAHQEEITTRPGELQNLLNETIFYFTNLKQEKLTDSHLQNCSKVINFLIPKLKATSIIRSIFGNPVLLQRFSPMHQEISTLFVIDALKQFQSLESVVYLDCSLKPFREKLTISIKKILKKGGKKSIKYDHLMEVLDVFGLEHQLCMEILRFWSQLNASDLDADFLLFCYNLMLNILKRFLNQGSLEPLDNGIIVAVSKLLMFLNKNEHFDSAACAETFKKYLENFSHSVEEVSVDLFESILTRNEFCKANSVLAGFLLKKRADFLDVFAQNISTVANKKGLMLPLLEAAISIKADDEILKDAYVNFEPSILRALQKPKKAGPHFETYRDIVALLIEKFMSEENCRSYMGKVQKFDTSEPFLIHMLLAMFSKEIFRKENDLLQQQLNNSILTLVHATNVLFKRTNEQDKLNDAIELTNTFFNKIVENKMGAKVSFRTLCENDGFHMYCKFCLKFGLSGNVALIKLLKMTVQFVDFEESEAQLLLEMAGSHSEFLELMLNEDCDSKRELLNLILVLCRRWPPLMQRNHVPVFLAAYRATIGPADRIILMLLQMYEKEASRTSFYDFKPFLWGTAAATHYSVRQDIQKALWRQPKMGDILDILQKDWVLNTITNYPLDFGLRATEQESNPQQHIYDLSFFLPLFSSLLAPENEVATYKFSRTGGLSLTITALSSNDKELRLAACHILARYHYHLEARQGQKDKALWLQYVEAICRGTVKYEDFKLNNFAAIFWAKMALLLTQPLNPLYVPMSHYLTARVVPDLKTIPELYTFLHGSDVNYKEMQMFILEILRDGLRTDNDFSVALHATAFRETMEMFSSCGTDVDTKKAVLSVLDRACQLNLGRKMLCCSYGLLSWLYEVIDSNGAETVLFFVVQILLNITKNVNNTKFLDFNILSLILITIIDKNLVSPLRTRDLNNFLNIAINVFSVNNKFLTKERLQVLISVANSKKCEYLLRYGCKYFDIDVECTESERLTQLLVTKWINTSLN